MADTKKQAAEHTKGGVTTKDPLDAGVPMAPGKPDEPIGPEDAFGADATRGDYSGRLYQGPHLVSEPVPDAKPGESNAKLVPVEQRRG